MKTFPALRFFAFCVLACVSNILFSQNNYIWVKFNSEKIIQPIAINFYMSGASRYVTTRQINVPSKSFYRFNCDSNGLVQFIPDYKGADSISILTYGQFSCSDSIEINVDKGLSKILNRKYIEFEQNFYYYLFKYFAKKNAKNYPIYAKEFSENFHLENEFLQSLYDQSLVSESFYKKKLLDLPYDYNNRLLSYPFSTDLTIDSLVTAHVYFDSLIESNNYTSFLMNYIYRFKIAKYEDPVLTDSCYYDFIFTKTVGKVREQLILSFFNTHSIRPDKNIKIYFEKFKSITADTNTLNSISKEIHQGQKELQLEYIRENFPNKLITSDLSEVFDFDSLIHKTKNKVILLHIWKSFSKPKKNEIFYTQGLQKKYNSNDLLIVYICNSYSFSEWISQSQKLNINEPNSYWLVQNDKNLSNKRIYSDEASRHILINKRGKIVLDQVAKAYDELFENKLKKILSK